MNWFADKLGPLPVTKSPGILKSGAQKGQQQAKSAPQQSAQRQQAQPQRAAAPPPKPAPEPDKKKKKGWF